jgi:hypothetical protein
MRKGIKTLPRVFLFHISPSFGRGYIILFKSYYFKNIGNIHSVIQMHLDI